jgi:hypothetical protein
MVSPGNPGDETGGRILSKDFGFRPADAPADLGRGGAAAGWRRVKGELKNSGPGRTADRLEQ